jgi:hypothetical protein
VWCYWEENGNIVENIVGTWWDMKIQKKIFNSSTSPPSKMKKWALLSGTTFSLVA